MAVGGYLPCVLAFLLSSLEHRCAGSSDCGGCWCICETMYRGTCIGTIYSTLVGFGGIQAIILSYSYKWLELIICKIILLQKKLCKIMKRTKRVEGLLCSHAKLQGKAQLCLLVRKSGPKNFNRQFFVLWWMLLLNMCLSSLFFP